jgi:trk system potassium uptake protein TrkH
MSLLLQRLPFLGELLFNGSFILLYSFRSTGKIPNSWSLGLVDNILSIYSQFIPFILFFVVITNYLNSKDIEDYLRKYIFSVVVFIPLIVTWGDVEFSFWLSSAHLLSSVLTLYDNDNSQSRPSTDINGDEGMVVKAFKLRPAQIILFSFVGVIVLGAFLLMLPVSAQVGKSISFIDAIFMATSATCVTGLTTLSLETDFSLFGQIVILLLIQIGGLGIMTLSSSMTILLGRSMAMKDRIIMQDLLDISSLEELLAMIVDIIKYTFFIELWGAIILTVAFTFEGFEFGTAIYQGFFHSISAFCNAGFSLFNNSLESYATNPLIHGTISVLVTFGGIGFIVLRELKEMLVKRRSLVRMSLHSKIVIVTSIVLTISGMIFIFFGEFLTSLDGYTLWEKLQISFFQSVTLRTAGFNSIPLTNLNTYTIYVMALFMFIGASPGSTGGGIKTTTLAILIQSIIATLKGDKTVSFFNRSIAAPIVVRATALTFISILLTSFFILVLMRLEPQQSFLPIFFEVISASGTVGLSLGITSILSVAGKFAIALLMLVGRIGPLTLLLALGEQVKSKGEFEYPQGRIMIG